MIKFKTFILLFAIFSINLFYSQKSSNDNNKNSILWEISGNNLPKSSYLIGTFHMLCKEDIINADKLFTALSKTEKLIVEVDMTDPSINQKVSSLMMSDKKISDQLSKEEIEEFQKLLENKPIKFEQINQMSKGGIMSLLTILSFKCVPQNMRMLDLELSNQAKQNGKNIVGLESIEEQMSLIENTYTARESLEYFKETNNKELMTQYISTYQNENISELYDLTVQSKLMNKKQKNSLLDGRNANWMTKIPNLISSNSCTIAVGAGHLWGEKGIINQLILKGFTVKPIFK